MMLSLSLWQPWASAIAVGAKKIETRSWGTAYRGPLAIHAAKKVTRALKLDTLYMGDSLGLPLIEPLPRGAVVCVVDLVDCYQMTEKACDEVSDLERQLGGWEPGRWAWVLANARPLGHSLPLRGQQGLWTLAQSVERDVLAELEQVA